MIERKIYFNKKNSINLKIMIERKIEKSYVSINL